MNGTQVHYRSYGCLLPVYRIKGVVEERSILSEAVLEGTVDGMEVKMPA